MLIPNNKLLLPRRSVAAPAVTSIAYVAHTTSTANTIVAPSSINAGDLLVLFDFAQNISGVVTDVVPTDWTSFRHAAFSPRRLRGSYKIADGTEDGSTITGMDGSSSDDKIMVQYRADVAIASFSASGGGGATSSGDPVQDTISASGGTPPVLGLVTFGSSGAISPRTTSITPNHELSSSTRFYLHDYVQNTSPADYTFDMDDEGAFNFLHGSYFHNFA